LVLDRRSEVQVFYEKFTVLYKVNMKIKNKNEGKPGIFKQNPFSM